MESPETKRKKYFSKGEILEKLKDNNYKIKELCEEICEELCPFDVSDEEALQIEDRLARMKKVSETLSAQVSRLYKAYKDRKFRHHPDKLNEKEISCSQFSLFQSDDSEKLTDFDLSPSPADSDMCENDMTSHGDTNAMTHPQSYKKKPLKHKMNRKTRSRRVVSKRETLTEWALEEGVSNTELLGYLLYLENYGRDLYL